MHETLPHANGGRFRFGIFEFDEATLELTRGAVLSLFVRSRSSCWRCSWPARAS